MLIKLAVSAICFLTCVHGLMNCGFHDARRTTLIYNATSIHACEAGKEKLEGCIIYYGFDNVSRVYVVPTEYMKRSYTYIWKIYNYTGHRNPRMFEDPETMYHDCAEILDLMMMQHHTYREFTQVVDHFKTAFKSSMPDGELPEIMVPPAEREKIEKEDALRSAKSDDDYLFHDYGFRNRVVMLPMYKIPLCEISVLFSGDTFFVHANLSIHMCHKEKKTLTFASCSMTSKPEEDLVCVDFKYADADDLELSINESRVADEINNNNNPFAGILKLAELWEPRVPCRDIVKRMQDKGWKLKTKDCFATDDEEEGKYVEMPVEAYDQPLNALDTSDHDKQHSTDL